MIYSVSIIMFMLFIAFVIVMIYLIVHAVDKSTRLRNNTISNTFYRPRIERLIGKINYAELSLSNILNNYLPKNFYTVYDDLLIETNGKTHQIDHLVISQFGVFVIENKAYSGVITGDKYDKVWVRHYNKNKKMYYENPIRQNYGHVKCIQELLHLNNKQVFNIACLMGNGTTNIKHDGELTRYDTIIERIMSYEDVVINNTQELCEIVQRANITDVQKRNEHIKRLLYTKENMNYNMCPKCGGKLVLRRGNNNKNFIGCSNYPRCRYTRKI